MTHLFETASQWLCRAAARADGAVFVERMAVEIEGEGEPVLMIHGLGGTANTFTPMLPAFSRHRTIGSIFPDRDAPTGSRARSPWRCSSTRLAWSWTGPASSAPTSSRTPWARSSRPTSPRRSPDGREPGALRSAAGPARAGPGGHPRPRRPGAPGRHAAHRGRPGPRQPLGRDAGAAARGRRLRPRVAHASGSRGLRAHLRGAGRDGPRRTSRIDCPTLLVTGDEDAVAPPQAVRMMGERIAGSRVEVLRGCGHWTPVEKPEECTGLLQRFLHERRPTWRTSSS